MYRDDVDALTARHDALDTEISGKTRERDEVAKLLAEARERTKLPVLENIRIASPCTADWSQMTGDDRVRHCGSCDKQVFDLSAMTRDEAEALIDERGGGLCARYYQRPDGTILLADCEVGVQRRARRTKVAAGAFAVLAASGSVAGWRAAAPPDIEPIDDLSLESVGEPIHLNEQEAASEPEREPLHLGVEFPWPRGHVALMGAISFTAVSENAIAAQQLAAAVRYQLDRKKLDDAYHAERAGLEAQLRGTKALAKIGAIRGSQVTFPDDE